MINKIRIAKRGYIKLANKHKNVIEINGKLYDTKHGVLLASQSPSTPAFASGNSIDGFFTPKPQTIITPSKPATYVPQTLKPLKHRHPAGHHKRPTQKSTILMRKSVKKPTVATKDHEIAPFSSRSRVHIRADRANNTKQSPYINKYRHVEHSITKRTESIPVVSPPKSAHHSTATHKNSHTQTHHSSKSEKLFSEALQRAEPAPKQKSHNKKHRRAARWSSGLLAGLLLAGFITYLNLPNLNVRFASARAGFSAAMPGYQPAGYAYNGPVSYEAGKVTISFKSNTDNRSYTVKQEVSNWNSQSLQENFLVANDKTFTTAQEAGRTIYMYDNGNATWVNGGVWYQVESNSLSSEQLTNIASSM